MGRTYILAFGGTGAKVVESVVMLMAAGAFGKEEIVPLLIDLESNNGNVSKCVRIIEEYRSIHNSIYATTDDREQNQYFFGSQLRNIEEVGHMQASVYRGYNWLLSAPGNRYDQVRSLRPLCQYNLNNGGANINTLAESLLGRHTEPQERGWDCGIARMLYSVFGIWSDLRILHLIATIRPIDRIIVVGSTFGCTGTVGMLELLKIFRKRLNVFGDVEKAFVLLNPYFDCCPDITHPDVRDAFADNSTSFYEAYDMFRDIGKTTFRIMPMEPRVVWEYVEDGLLQTNPSTPSELLAAIAIHDFVKRPNHNRDTVDCILREGTRANIHELIVSSPVLGNTSDISGDLGYFSIFTYCIEKKGLLAGLDNRPAFRHAFRDVPHYERTTELINRFVHLYEDWWTEISVVGGFRIFDFNADVLKKLIVGKYLPPYGLFGMLSDSYDTLCREFDRRFNRIYPHNQISLYGALLAAFRGATASLTDVPLRSI